MIDPCLPVPGAQRDDWLLWVELGCAPRAIPELAGDRRPPVCAPARMVRARRSRRHRQRRVRRGDADARADRLLALIDGYGMRALMGDPAVTLERARAEVWAAFAARTLGLED